MDHVDRVSSTSRVLTYLLTWLFTYKRPKHFLDRSFRLFLCNKDSILLSLRSLKIFKVPTPTSIFIKPLISCLCENHTIPRQYYESSKTIKFVRQVLRLQINLTDLNPCHGVSFITGCERTTDRTFVLQLESMNLGNHGTCYGVYITHDFFINDSLTYLRKHQNGTKKVFSNLITGQEETPLDPK